MSDDVNAWLSEGTATETDWGGYVTRLAMRGDLGDGGEGLLLDLPALAQPYACNSVACAPGLRAAKTRSCCADLDAEPTSAERAAIEAARDELAAFLAPRDPRWRSGPPTLFAGDVLTRPDGRCVFAVAGPTGLACALHTLEDSTGRARGTLKPMACRLFPLIVVDLEEGRLLLTAVSPHTARHADLPPPRTFPCLRGDTTTEQRLVRGVRDTITELWGAATAGRVERAVTRWARAG